MTLAANNWIQEEKMNNYPSNYIPILIAYCKKIVPYVYLYKKQIDYYNCTAYEILTKEISWILHTFPKDKTHNRGIIASLSQVFSVWHLKKFLAFYILNGRKQCITHSWHWKRKKICKETKFSHLGDSMVMYGIYNSDTFEQLTDTGHRMHNQMTFNEKLFAGKIFEVFLWFLSKDGVGHYATNSLLFITTEKDM